MIGSAAHLRIGVGACVSILFLRLSSAGVALRLAFCCCSWRIEATASPIFGNTTVDAFDIGEGDNEDVLE